MTPPSLLLFSALIVICFLGSAGIAQGQFRLRHQRLSGTITYVSYASGNWEIWTLFPHEKKNFQLTQTVEEEQYPAFSPDGGKIAFATNLGQMWIIGPGKIGQKIPSLPENCTQPAWSPDGSKIIFVAYTFVNGKEDSDLWVAELNTGLVTKLVLLDKIQRNPAWSPDGSRIVYTSAYLPDKGKPIEDLYTINADGTKPEPLVTNGAANIQPNWSPDGDRIVFASEQTGNMEIWVLNLENGKAKQLTGNPAYDGDPCWSPDGTSICFVSTRSGKMDIWVMDGDGKNPRQLTGLLEQYADSKDPYWSP